MPFSPVGLNLSVNSFTSNPKTNRILKNTIRNHIHKLITFLFIYLFLTRMCVQLYISITYQTNAPFEKSFHSYTSLRAFKAASKSGIGR